MDSNVDPTVKVFPHAHVTFAFSKYCGCMSFFILLFICFIPHICFFINPLYFCVVRDIKKTMIADTKINQTQADPVIKEMTRAGLNFGHKTSKTHPKMKPYIVGVRNTVHMFDLEKTKEKLQKALEYIQSLQVEGKILLLVGTKVQVKNLVKETAKACNLPYVSERWIGGTFTNFGTIAKRIEYFRDLEQKKETGELEKYTKKEQLDIAEELKNLELRFGGIKNLSKLPDVVFICDLDKNQLVLKEAKDKGIPVVAIVDTNIDPTSVDYIIPANDDAQSSVRYILGKIQELYVSQSNYPDPQLKTPSVS